VNVGSLEGSGGSERQFADFFVDARRRGEPDVSLLTSRASADRLRATGRLASADGVILLPLGRWPTHGWLRTGWLTLALLWVTLKKRFDLVHICLPTPSHVPFAAVLAILPPAWRPKLTMTIVDCTLAPNLASGRAEDRYERQVLDAHSLYFRWCHLDGVYSWYEAFLRVSEDLRLLPPSTRVTAARYCFTDTARFRPAPCKDRLVVFAGRFSAQKRPLLFVDAVAELRAREPALTAGWRFEMYGRGELEAAIAARVAALNIQDVLTVTHAIDMAPVFGRSRLFVSTQAFENFTSLAMLEAMAAGNAVIAEDVGQTGQLVRPENGIVVRSGTSAAFAEAIAAYLRHPEQHTRMADASRAIATGIHTVEHFADDIATFWRSVLNGVHA